jgi:streptogramin lyase
MRRDLMPSTARRRCGVAFVIACVALVFSAVGGSAASESAIHGSFFVYSVPAAETPVQLIAGTSGDIWFITATSQLGTITSAGAISLLPVTVPHGNVPAKLVEADADGVWAYGDTSDGMQCVVSLIRPGGHVMQRTLGHPIGVCHGGAVDPAGNLWVSAGGPQSSYETCPCRVVEVSPSGALTVHLPDTSGARPTAVALGSDGAIWVLEFNEHLFGRYAADGSSTSVGVGGSVPPPYPGTPHWGLVPNQLFARPDGTFWLAQGGCCNAVALSLPGSWVVRYLLPSQVSVAAMSPDGALWTVNFDRGGFPTERLVRTAVNGQLDRSAALPAPAPGQVMDATGPLAASTNGAVWMVTATSKADYVVRYQPVGT